MSELYDVAAIGNAIVDVIAPADDAFLTSEGLDKGAMMLIDEARGRDLYSRMAPGVETSGGSAGNTIAGVASYGGRAAYLGKVADDQLGEAVSIIGKSAQTGNAGDGKIFVLPVEQAYTVRTGEIGL